MLHGDLASLLGELGGVVAVQRASLAPKVTLAKNVKVAAGVARDQIDPAAVSFGGRFYLFGNFFLRRPRFALASRLNPVDAPDAPSGTLPALYLPSWSSWGENRRFFFGLFRCNKSCTKAAY